MIKKKASDLNCQIIEPDKRTITSCKISDTIDGGILDKIKLGLFSSCLDVYI